MAHNVSFPARFLDFINREGFEWLMHPINNYRYYQHNYRDRSPSLRYWARLAFTGLFTVLPVIPALYVASRTLTVFSEFRANPIKTGFMSLVAGGMVAGIYTLGFGTIVNTMSSWVPSFLSFMPALVPAPFIVGGILAIAGAALFYGAKLAAQAINSYRFYGLTSTSKHQLPQSKHEYDNLPAMQTLYNQILIKQHDVKGLLKQPAPPAAVSDADGIFQFPYHQQTILVPTIEYAIETGKNLLNNLEEMTKKSNEDKLDTTLYNQVFGGGYESAIAPNLQGVYNQYKSGVVVAAPTEKANFTVADDSKGQIVHDVANRKLRSYT